jgi:hypothetical protein
MEPEGVAVGAIVTGVAESVGAVIGNLLDDIFGDDD